MILITGANGQLGTELRYLLDECNEEYVAVDVAEMDITNAEMVEKVFSEVKPSLVYHCAAYTAVDAAEDEGKELRMLLKQQKSMMQHLFIYLLTMFLLEISQLVRSGR